MDATLRILKEAGAQLQIETIEVGEQVYKRGDTTGIPADAWESLRRTKILLKAPITTPQGGGYKSLNVTMRKKLGLYANIRPNVSYAPFVKTHFPRMDMVIIRENEEDLYAGVEYRSTPDAHICLKIITRAGCERIIRYAFEYCVQNGRKKLTCMSKDNIMKITDGLFHKVFNEIGAEYPQIQQDHFIIDIGSARIATAPNRFDAIVTSNLYGDIISDIAADVSGSVGLAGSSNIGRDFAMFEAIHGSAPDIAGQGIANPSGLLNGALMMLIHIGQYDVATRIHNAWLCTLEDGIHTGDIYQKDVSTQKVGTADFANAVIERLGKVPHHFAQKDYAAAAANATNTKSKIGDIKLPTAKQELVGTDVYIYWVRDYEELGATLSALPLANLKLQMLTCKGLKVWPGGAEAGMNLSDYFRCRFKAEAPISLQEVSDLLATLTTQGIGFARVENLYHFDGVAGFTMGQGE
jgi:isocitrate dehydrogenase